MDLPIADDGPSWAPAACTLPTAERPTRQAEFDALFADGVRHVERRGPTALRLTLRPTPDVAAHAAGLAMRETRCCSFFTFTLVATGGALDLDVTTPAEHAAVLDALADRAERAGR